MSESGHLLYIKKTNVIVFYFLLYRRYLCTIRRRTEVKVTPS